MRMVRQFAEEHGLEQARVCLELADGSRHTLASLSPEPGFGFFSFVPYGEDEPRRVVVPIGAVKLAELCLPDDEQQFGFAPGPAS
jgi:hypothetical protein